MSRKITVSHDENYDSDKEKKHGMGDRRLSKVEDKRLRTTLAKLRNSSQKELKEECLRNEWYGVVDDKERTILKDCVDDEAFWEEVKELARKELETTPEVMGEDQFRAMFKEFDADGSGSIDADELRKLLSVAMGMDCSTEEVTDLMKLVDTDGNAEIDESEFLEIMNAAKEQQRKTVEIDKPLIVTGPSQIPADVAARVRSPSQFIPEGGNQAPPRRSMRSPDPTERVASKSPTPLPTPAPVVEETSPSGKPKPVEEYKEMLKRRMEATRANAEATKAREDAQEAAAQEAASRPEEEEEKPKPVSSPRTRPGGYSARRPSEGSASPSSAAAASPPVRPYRNLPRREEPKEPEKPSYELKETRLDGHVPLPPMQRKPRAYSGVSTGKSGKPSYMRTTQSSTATKGKSKKK